MSVAHPAGESNQEIKANGRTEAALLGPSPRGPSLAGCGSTWSCCGRETDLVMGFATILLCPLKWCHECLSLPSLLTSTQVCGKMEPCRDLSSGVGAMVAWPGALG